MRSQTDSTSTNFLVMGLSLKKREVLLISTSNILKPYHIRIKILREITRNFKNLSLQISTKLFYLLNRILTFNITTI